MIEFFGIKVTEREIADLADAAVTGLGRCQVMLEFAQSVEDRVFAIAAYDAFLKIAKECFRVLP